ncbi:MAG TPA: phosphosulfolactate synthase [Calidithermus sp.]|nr:phosphosulfolactate synthase [Calidithermus sp.]
MTAPFPDSLAAPREGKPRRRGQTWISLFGEGLKTIEDLLVTAGPFIDRAKLAYGSSLLLDRGVLRTMMTLLHKAEVDVYPGGTLVEMAIRAGRYDDLLAWARDVGFTGIEVCDGVIELPAPARRAAIERALVAGFRVTTVVQEVVRKPLVEVVPLKTRIERAREDLAAGATDVHIVFQALMRGETPGDVVGPIKREHVRALLDALGPERLVWEASRLEDQLFYLRTVGRDANLGHVPPATVVQLEAQRRELGYETFWSRVWQRPHWD